MRALQASAPSTRIKYFVNSVMNTVSRCARRAASSTHRQHHTMRAPIRPHAPSKRPDGALPLSHFRASASPKVRGDLPSLRSALAMRCNGACGSALQTGDLGSCCAGQQSSQGGVMRLQGTPRIAWKALVLGGWLLGACAQEQAALAELEPTPLVAALSIESGGTDCDQDYPAQCKVALGQKLFNDTSLSASGTLSCAGCHSDTAAGSGNNKPDDPLFPVSLGAFSELVGQRNSPSARYAAFNPKFSIVEETEEGETEYVPMGGQFWDGRADTLAAQAAGPFLNPLEMALPDKQSVLERVQAAEYAPLFRAVFGQDVFDDVDAAYAHLTDAIAAFEQTDAFAPFDSKFDAVLRGEAELSAEEARGFELFKDPEKGNCLACHVGDLDSRDPRAWLFTDFTYDNIGVPRNPQVPANHDAQTYDLGLCQQSGLRERVPAPAPDPDAYVQSLCGAFKVPSLRNVARTAPYMHNGYFTDLRAVVDFYATRDTQPGRWYPCGEDANVHKFDDVPEAYRANVNTSESPMDRQQGDEPRLQPDEIDAIVAFLRTLSDGY